MTRYKAFAIHLLGSILVLSVIFLLIKVVWYPGTLFTFAAGFDLLRLIVIVDLVIGPLIMLVIFNPKKKYIKLDIAILLLCQIGFMAYGCWTMFVARPVYFAFADNSFYLVRANEIDKKDLAQVKDQRFKQIPLWGPIVVGTKEPDDVKIRNDIVLSSLAGMGIQDLPQYFVPYNQVLQHVKSAAKTSRELKVDHATKQRVTTYEQSNPHKAVLFLPMLNKQALLIAVVDAKTAQFIQAI